MLKCTGSWKGGVAAAFKTKFKKPVITVKEGIQEKASDYVDVEIKAPGVMLKIYCKSSKDVKIEPSPDWMGEKRLRAAGVRPTHNIVDITNYVR